MVALLFGWFGVCGVTGNVIAGALMDRIGAERVATLALAALLFGQLLWPLTHGSLAFTMLAAGSGASAASRS